MQNQPRDNSFLGTAPLGRLMRMFSVPCIISLLVAALYNIVDQIFIANADYLGSYGNAANTVVFPMTMIALSLAVMIGDGACTFVSISLGAKNPENAHKTVGSAVILCLVVSAVLTTVYLVFSTPILAAFGGMVNERTFELSKEYFTIISIGIPFYMFGQCMNPIIRSDGSPRFAMGSTVAGALVNVVLDPIMIYGFKWGMAGAAWATIIGQMVTAALAVWYMMRMKAVKLQKSSFRLHVPLAARFVPMGLTSFLSQISVVASMAAVQNMTMQYGALDPIFSQDGLTQIPMAVLGIVMKFFQIVIAFAVGFSAGCIPIVGYNIGAGRKDRAKRLFQMMIGAELVTGLAALAIVECFPGQLIRLFGAAGESSYYTEFAIRCFRVYLCMLPLATINKGTFIYLQALGKAVLSSGISLVREIVFGCGLPILLPVFFGLDGVLYSMPAADVLTFLIAAAVIVHVMQQLDVKDGGERSA
ncbi:MAG: MATE family efflux transporter [Clostridia bacterium]|nr:MATE family efflux transporter [Clostridia bacterium]